jgi:thioredoxin reductase (NADPH)
MNDKSNSNTYKTKVLIIGSGPAGYTAAIYAARASLEPIIVTGSQPGGQLTITTDVENYPGFGEIIQGPYLMEQMELQARKVGAEILEDHIVEVDLSGSPFICKGESGKGYIGSSLIIATGAQAKWLGIESEEKYRGFGVSGCATCDGFFFKNKQVVVIGGGNTAIEDALFLANHASQVIVVHRRSEFRAEKILQARLFSHPKIRVIWDTVLEEIIGTENPLSVNAVRLRNLITNEVMQQPTHGVFIAIGHTPNISLFKGKLDMDVEGYIITKNGGVETGIPGVFAAGDVQDKIYRQAITAAGTGCMAALEAAKFLMKR